MVRNFGERRKKKRGHNNKKSKSKSLKPLQEEVTCREVAIYVPSSQDKIESKELPKANKMKNSYRYKREHRRRRARTTLPCGCRHRDDDDQYYNDYDSDNCDDDDEDLFEHMMNMSITNVRFTHNRIILEEIPLLPLLLSSLFRH